MIDKQRIKQRMQYVRPLFVPMIFYFGLLVISATWASKLENTALRYTMALLPMIPGTFLAFGLIQAVKKIDEMERRIILEAIAFSFIATLMLLLSLSLLGLVGMTQVNYVYIVLIMAIFLVIGKLWGNWRYR